MKSDIHPNYRPVVFRDAGADFSFITQSTVETTDTIVWEDGNEYPLVTVELSSASHTSVSYTHLTLPTIYSV